MKNRQNGEFPLLYAKEGEKFMICELKGGKLFRDKCISMGIIPGIIAEISNNSPGGPCLLKIGDSRIILGGGMMHRIFVKRV
ncbi:FeoA domain-containing protein [candidate division WOR-3 bacterium]|nr:FeoA domain-containing protein [candidate division WOR-3 bacterium]